MQNEETSTALLPDIVVPQGTHSPAPATSQPSPPVRRAPDPVEAAEITRQGWELYQHQIARAVEPHLIGKFISIDVDTEEYAVADDHLSAAKQLIAKKYDARTYSTHIGFKEMYYSYTVRHAG